MNPREARPQDGIIGPDPEEVEHFNTLHGSISPLSKFAKGVVAVLGLGTAAFVTEACARPTPPAEVRPAIPSQDTTPRPTEILTPTPKPTPTETPLIAVEGAKQINLTGIEVKRGEILIFQASGTWCMGFRECGGPDGIRYPASDEPDVVLPKEKIGTLLGVIRTSESSNGRIIFPIGSSREVKAEADGSLILLMNERAGYYRDNSGSLAVKIEKGSSGFIKPKEIPTQTVLTPKPREAPPPASTPTPKEVVQENPIKIFPTKFEITDYVPGNFPKKTEEGWKWISMNLTFENISNKPQSVGLVVNKFPKSKILSKEGFRYEVYDVGDGFLRDSMVPPGFRMSALWFAPYGFDIPPQRLIHSTMSSKVAKNTSGYKLQIPDLPEIDIEQEVEKGRNIRFPTDRPDSGFKEFGGSFEIPSKGTVTFIDVERGEVEPPYHEKREVILLRTRFKNASQGQEQNFSLGLSIIDDEGVFYPSGVGITVPPGLSREATTIFPREINEGKLIVRGDLNEIFNLKLNPPDSRILRIVEYRDSLQQEGISFTVDRAEIVNGKLRVRINIKTSRYVARSQRLILNKNKLYAFNSQQARQYREEFLFGGAYNDKAKIEALLREVNPKEFALRPTSDTEVPKTLNPGDSWLAWFETEDPLTLTLKDLAGFYVHLEPVTDRSVSWDSYASQASNDPWHHPFIEIIK